MYAKKSLTQHSKQFLEIIAEYDDYWVVYDRNIPGELKNNIVLNAQGMMKIANYYQKKYGIEILVDPSPITIEILAAKITALLHRVKQEYPRHQKMGFIFISMDDSNDLLGHALPMIFERDNTQEHLFFLDTSEFFNTVTGVVKDKICLFQQSLQAQHPQLHLWRIFGCRQLDYSSCYIDAMVMLKDGLRVPSFKLLVENRVFQKIDNITIFYAPPLLIRTAQIGSFFEKSQVALTDRIDRFNTKKASITVEAFKRQYDITVLDPNGNQKNVGLFTIKKGQRYAALIQKMQNH